MGAGRKTKTLPLKEKAGTSWTVNCSAPARNLRKSDLGAVIFGCKHNTIDECHSEKLFGLPAPHFAYVKNISPGLPLFLFNYSDRKLHGIYEAASQGQMNISPYGWTADGPDYTPYAAQVRVLVREQCLPLLEDEFRPLIADNYYEPRLFWFELDRAQTHKLISMFTPRTSVSRPLDMAMRNDLRTSDPGHISDDIWDQASQVDFAPSNVLNVQWSSWDALGSEKKEMLQQKTAFGPSYSSIVSGSHTEITGSSFPEKKWSTLFKTSTNSNTPKEDENSLAQTSEANFKHSNMESASSSDVPCPKSENDHFEAHNSESASGNYEAEWEYPSDATVPAFYSSCEAPTGVDTTTRQGDEEFKDAASDANHPCLDESNMDEGFSSATQTIPHPDEESVLSEASADDNVTETFVEPLHPEASSGCSHSSTGIETISKDNDIHSFVVKLVEEVEKLKASHQKISSLHQELAESKAEIFQLKTRCYILESRLLSSAGHVQEKVIESCDEFHPMIDDSILIVGGFDGYSWLSALSSYLPSRDMMRSLKPMTSVRKYASAATLNGELYVFGGEDGSLWHDTVESYNPISDRWLSCPLLNQKKGSLAGASLCGKIFAIGGGNGIECYSEVEMLDMNIGKWIPTRSMLHKRFAPAATELNGALYVVGGYNGKKYLDSVERFDPREHSWKSLESMSTSRGCHSLTVLNDKLYALGGFDGLGMVSTIEIFDPRVGSWMMGESMNSSRGYSGAAVLGEKIYVIGGIKDNDEILDTIECYKEGCGWEVTGLKAVGKRCFFSAIVL